MKLRVLIFVLASSFSLSHAHLSNTILQEYFQKIINGNLGNLYNDLVRDEASLEDIDVLDQLLDREEGIFTDDFFAPFLGAQVNPLVHQVRVLHIQQARPILDSLRERLYHRVPELRGYRNISSAHSAHDLLRNENFFMVPETYSTPPTNLTTDAEVPNLPRRRLARPLPPQQRVPQQDQQLIFPADIFLQLLAGQQQIGEQPPPAPPGSPATPFLGSPPRSP